MNRHQRRTAARTRTKRDVAPAPAPLETQAPAPAAEPGLLLRLVANVLLAPWVLKRVRHADLERLLAGVAIQAARPEIAAQLLQRLAARNDAKR